jgi:hypothetical protein
MINKPNDDYADINHPAAGLAVANFGALSCDVG